MKRLSYTGLLSFVSAAITDGTVEYKMRTVNTSGNGGETPGFAKFTYLGGVLTGGVNWSTTTGPPQVLDGVTAISQGTYDPTGAALTNPSVELWGNAGATANAFWAEDYTTSQFYYSATIDSALDRIKGNYHSTKGSGTFDLILPSVTSWLTAEEQAAADAKENELSDGLNLAAWKIATALTYLIPCDDPWYGQACGDLDMRKADGEEYKVKSTCGRATMPAATSGLHADEEFNIVGCFPLTYCGRTDAPVPGTTAVVYALECGAQKLLAGFTATAAVAFAMWKM